MSQATASQQSRQTIVDVLGAESPQLWDAEAPLVFADDLAAIRGDGVFETMMLRDGVVHNMERHRARFLSSAAMLELDIPDMQRWAQATELAVAHFQDTVGAPEAALRWVYSRGRESTGAATGWITVSPIGSEIERARAEGVTVMTAERGFRIDLSERSPWALIGAKTLSYAANMAALRYAKAREFDDVIFVSDEGQVLEGPTSSIIAVFGRTLVTPPIEAGVLPGTSQAALFRLAKHRGWDVGYRSMQPSDLHTADCVWLVSSVRAFARVKEIDGVVLGNPDNAEEIQQMMWEAVTS